MFKGAVLRYLLSDALSLIGNSIAGVVLPLVLLARTGDVLAAGSLALICAVPQFVCGVVGGAVLDRVNRRTVSVVADLISAASCALLPMVDQVWGLSFGWFVALGLLGAAGDVPGMSARDALLPSVCEREGADLQRFVGASQSLGALVNIIGPAVAALLIGFMNDVDALWITAAFSCAAALVTLTLPRDVGEVSSSSANADAVVAAASDAAPCNDAAPKKAGMLAAAKSVLVDGLSALFATDALLRASTLLSFGITMVMGSLQGIVLPAYFTQLGQPQAVGYVVSAMGAGLLVGSTAYTALAHVMSRRRWLVVSLLGMAVSVCMLGQFPALPVLLAAAAVLGLLAGPASALLGFFAFDRVPDDRRGSAMGTLNALYLVVAPAGAFVGSVLISAAQIDGAGLVLTGAWVVVTALALIAPPLRHLDDEVEAPLADASSSTASDTAPGPATAAGGSMVDSTVR